jgi:hypothetical protein
VHTLSSELTVILLVFKIVDDDEEKEEQPLGQMVKLKRLEDREEEEQARARGRGCCTRRGVRSARTRAGGRG